MTGPREALPPFPNSRTASGHGASPHASGGVLGVSPAPPSAPSPRLLPLSALLGEYEDDARSRWEARTKGLRRGPVSGLSGLDEAIGGALEPGLHVLHGGPGVGKAQPVGARVLTPTGFRRMGELVVGDRVIGADGRSTTVVGVFPQGPKPVYRLTFADGGQTECCDEHLWLTSSRTARKHGFAAAVRTTAQLRATLHAGDGRPNHHIPWMRPAAFPAQRLPLSPYLLGVYLGDGRTSGSTSPVISNPEPDVQQRIVQAVPPGDVAVVAPDRITVRIRKRRSGAVLSKTGEALTALGLMGKRSEEKFVPEAYLLGSIAQRVALLQGLLDTDGSVQSNGVGVEYVTTSGRLARDVRFLAGSLGGRVATTVTAAPASTYRGERRTGQVAYRLRLTFPEGHVVPVSSAKHLARYRPRTRTVTQRVLIGIESAGEKECRCIAVAAPDRLYVTDDFVVTHNTAIALQMAAACGFPALYVTTEMRPVELLRRLTARITGTYLGRLKSGELAPEDAVAKAREAIAAAPHLGIADACDVYATPDWLREAAYAVRGDARHLLIVVDSVHTWSEMGAAEAVGLVGAGVVTEYTALDASLAALRLLAQHLACPVLGIAERNRASMLTGGLHASAGNRGFEYAGETVLSLDVTDKPTPPVGPDAKPIVLHVVKNRHGRTGDRLLLAFNGALQRFEEVAGGQERGR